jgi:glycosyltransferase involved in cell wall biosynthesis
LEGIITDAVSICILPRLEGLGGPASFRARLSAGLARRGIQTHQNPDDPTCRAVLVIGATRRLGDLLRARRRGVRLVQRLNGMNWIHRIKHTGAYHFLRSEWNNFILSFTRRWLAEAVVYQSSFARDWWQTVHGGVRAPGRIVYNGVDLAEFNPLGPAELSAERTRLLLVEGRLGGGYEIGLENALGLAQRLARTQPRPVELEVVGQVPEALRERCEREGPGLLRWRGVVRREEIPFMDRSADLLFSADLNAACPNSVIEALACGLPVVSFATGSLPELVEGSAGRVVPWGSNYWKLQRPDLDGLAQAASAILAEPQRYRPGARARAEEAFGLEQMVDRYLDVLLG